MAILLGASYLNDISVGTSITKFPIPEGTKMNISQNSNHYCTVKVFDQNNNSTVLDNNVNLTSSRTYNLSGYSFVSVSVTSRQGRGQTNTTVSFSK